MTNLRPVQEHPLPYYRPHGETMKTKSIGRVAVLTGAVILAVALLADVVGLGQWPGFGLRQALIGLLGVTLAGVGIWLMRQP